MQQASENRIFLSLHDHAFYSDIHLSLIFNGMNESKMSCIYKIFRPIVVCNWQLGLFIQYLFAHSDPFRKMGRK